MDKSPGAIDQTAEVSGSHNTVIQVGRDLVLPPDQHGLVLPVLNEVSDREGSNRSRRTFVGAPFAAWLIALLAILFAIDTGRRAPSPDARSTTAGTPSNHPAMPTEGGNTARPPAPSSPEKSVPRNHASPDGRGTESGSGPGDPATVVPPEQSESVPFYHSWLRRDGAVIRYNAAVHMPGSCPGRIMAVGDFGPGGWTRGPEARCEADGWLTFDAGQLLKEPRFVPGHTYCLNFLDERGRYGQHGAPPRAPGLFAIGVPSREGEQAGITMGFRVVRSADGPLVEFTNEGIPHCE